MRSLEQRARARLGEIVRGFELDWVEGTDVLTASFIARGDDKMASISILHPRWALLPGFSAGFLSAVRQSQNIEHSIVPRVLDFGMTDDQLPYVAHEFLGGETLETYLKRRQATIPPAEALRIGAALGDGLAGLAERGVNHGAVQPRSVALMESGAVRLLHTGWTRLRQQAAAHLGSSSIPGLTGYLSSAQAKGEAAGARDDLWSLGAIVFELLTGVPLRRADTEEERLYAAQHQSAPSLADVVPSAPGEIVALIDSTLLSGSTERVTSAAEFASRCRSLALFPHVFRLRRLARRAATRDAIAEGPVRPSRLSSGAPSHSGVSPLDLPPAVATGTAEPRPSRVFGPPLGGAGTYSSRGGAQCVDTLFPKKR